MNDTHTPRLARIHGPFPYADATALVTGPTSGIGLAIARALAEKGVPRLVLAARSADDLKRVADELRAASPGLRAETVPVDLSEPDGADHLHSAVAAMGLTVDLLVSNAGVGAAGPFGEDAARGAAPVSVVDLNVRAIVRLAELYVAEMTQRGGGIVHVASTAADQPVPFSAVYGASKAFVLSFSQALHTEYRLRGVRVVCVVPGVTRTDLAGPGKGEPRGGLEALSTSEPSEVAQTALAALDANDPSRIVGVRNRALSMATELVPRALSSRVLAYAKRPDGYESVAPFPVAAVAGAAAGILLVVGAAIGRSR